MNDKLNSMENSEAHVDSTRTFKIPTFWRTNPELWFKQIESVFYTTKITADASKFHHVISSMESGNLAQASDIVLNPPETKMYDVLKNRLIERFSESEQCRLKKLQ